MLTAESNTSVPQSSVDTRLIHRSTLLERLDISETDRPLADSVRRSTWYEIDGGRSLLECRNPVVSKKEQTSHYVEIFDLDDNLFSATGWHNREFQLLAESEVLQRRGIYVAPEQAQDIYNLSKINVEGLAEKEPRYTPKLNLVLLTFFARFYQKGWNSLLEHRRLLYEVVRNVGEEALDLCTVDQDIAQIFLTNPPSRFVYSGFVNDIVGRTHLQDVRIIATRGKIEGPLGQVYKVHSSGLMRPDPQKGPGMDMVVYCNDIKAETLLKLLTLYPWLREKHVRIYDDNPNEVIPYLSAIYANGIRGIEVVYVNHPDAKRKGINIGIEPGLVVKTRSGTEMYHYYAIPKLFEDQPQSPNP